MTRIVMNPDGVGTGNKGVYILNGKEVPDELSLYEQINKDKAYVTNMKAIPAEPSSDHASFYEKDVKAVFIYAHDNNSN